VLWRQGEAFELVAHGLVAQRYGLDTMVRAVALLAEAIPNIVLHIYGKGAYITEVEALAQRLGVAERVIAHGFVPEEELLDGISRAHVGVIAAKSDAFRDLTHTQKMYEYVAMRTPVVIAETPAVRTHFDDSCFQFFVSDDAEDLARALRELYCDPLRALAMVESSSRRYRWYAWEAQRHVYCDAVLGGAWERMMDDGRWTMEDGVMEPVSISSSPVGHRPSSATGLVPMRVETIPNLGHRDLSEIVMPVEDGGTFLSEMAMPEAEIGFNQGGI
jgi:hypothetical protein